MSTQKNKKLRLSSRHQLAISLTIIILLVVGLFIVSITLILNNNHSKTSKSDVLISNFPSKVLSSQQPAQSSAFSIVIIKASEDSKNDPAFSILDSETILYVQLSITNKTEKIQDLYPVNQFYVKGTDGSIYFMHPTMYATEPLQSGKINPGQTTSGQVTFALPKNLAKPLLYIDLGWDNYVPVVYDILQ